MFRLIKFLVLIFTVAIFCLAFSKSVSAAPLFSFTTNPSPLYTDSSNRTFNISSDTPDTFKKDLHYVWWFAKTEATCPDETNYATFVDGQHLSIDLDNSSIIECVKKAQTLKFQLWVGEQTTAPSSSNLIISDYQLVIEPPGGSITSLTPVKTPIQVGNAPSVVIINTVKDQTYSLWWDGARINLATNKYRSDRNGSSPELLLQETSGVKFSEPGTRKLCMVIGSIHAPAGVPCDISTTFEFTALPTSKTPSCSLSPNPITVNDHVVIKANGLTSTVQYRADLDKDGANFEHLPATTSSTTGDITIGVGTRLGPGNYTVYLYDSKDARVTGNGCDSMSFSPGGTSGISGGTGGAGSTGSSCKAGTPGCSSSAGLSCSPTDGKAGTGGVLTAIGCVPTDPLALINGLMGAAVGVGGGIAFLLMIFGAFQMITSAGNPEAIKKGQEQFTSAIIGLLFIIFSTLLLKIIGADILAIPGFG